MIFKELHALFFLNGIGLWLIHFIWQASVIAIITSLLLLILKKFSAKLRYIICFLSLLLMILLPCISTLSDSIEPNDKVAVTPVKILYPILAKNVYVNGKYIATQYRGNEFFSVPNEEIIAHIGLYLPYITFVWLAGVLLISLYHVLGFFKLRKLVQQASQELEPFWIGKIQEFIKKLKIKRNVLISKLPGLETPVVIGCLKPVLLLPVSFFTGMNNEYIEAIILHELGHIKRYDYLLNMIQVMIEILGFFHPAVWWLSKKIREERENCCDDIAVNIIGNRLIYAKSLVQLEECRNKNKLILAANSSNLLRRTARILMVKETRNFSFLINFSGFFIALFCLFILTGFIWKQNIEILNKTMKDKTSESFIRNISKNLIAFYPFNGNANDESGYNQNGLVYNAVLTKDRAGNEDKAFDFNGKDSYIKIPNTTALNTHGSITISCWIFPRKSVKYESWISKSSSNHWASQWRVGFGEDVNHEWGLSECHLVNKQNIWTDYWITKSAIMLKEWTHVTIVADQAAGYVYLYVNGRKVVQFDNLKSFDESNTPLLIGFQKDDTVYFDGKIDDIRIYNRSLTDQEVNAIYNID